MLKLTKPSARLCWNATTSLDRWHFHSISATRTISAERPRISPTYLGLASCRPQVDKTWIWPDIAGRLLQRGCHKAIGMKSREWVIDPLNDSIRGPTDRDDTTQNQS